MGSRKSYMPPELVGPLLLAVAMAVGAGRPAPKNLVFLGPDEELALPDSWATMTFPRLEDVRAWAAWLDVPCQIRLRDTSVRAECTVMLAGVEVQVWAYEDLDDEATIDARDRAADRAELAALATGPVSS